MTTENTDKDWLVEFYGQSIAVPTINGDDIHELQLCLDAIDDNDDIDDNTMAQQRFENLCRLVRSLRARIGVDESGSVLPKRAVRVKNRAQNAGICDVLNIVLNEDSFISADGNTLYASNDSVEGIYDLHVKMFKMRPGDQEEQQYC